MAQLVEWLLPTQKVHSSYPVIGKFCVFSTVLKSRKQNKKGLGYDIFIETKLCHLPLYVQGRIISC